eukprot:CAMPEP_0175119978 /NCGR_PEP_ID=MMETSP0087-20121206/366_1 /TAXON_ID=136419 /ORGANISM="Unknown Unknown, Strain D1" /LENGTH=395 /DNA_ID=CAMNT_0016401375 /DNA_START=163 /DNA_END=1350 /DNA_ORIENTATION=+
MSCKPFAPLGHDGSRSAWKTARSNLISSIFGGELPPTRSIPDVGPESVTTPITFGNAMCLLRGECHASACARPINLTAFSWNISLHVNETFGNLTLTSKVFHSLNTSGIAAGNSEKFDKAFDTPEVEWPEVDIFPQELSDTLVIFHDGHTVTNGCHYDVEETVDWLNQLGYDVMHIQMPLHGCNAEDPLHPMSHSWFEQFAGPDGASSDTFPFMRFFLEPVWLTINYAQSLGYKRIVMAGLSGGGFTTHVAAAIDDRIGLSIPVAGSVPCDFAHTSWDYEQYCNQPWATVANYTSLYVLASLEADRSQVQVLHEWDNCCFHGCGRHERIAKYNDFVRASGQGQFVTSVTAGNIHEVNPRDRVIIASVVELWRRGSWKLTKEDLARIPFSLTPLSA